MNFQKAVEYLRSFEADGLCRVVGFDSFGEKIIIADCTDSFFIINNIYLDMTFGVNLTYSGTLKAEAVF